MSFTPKEGTYICRLGKQNKERHRPQPRAVCSNIGVGETRGKKTAVQGRSCSGTVPPAEFRAFHLPFGLPGLVGGRKISSLSSLLAGDCGMSVEDGVDGGIGCGGGRSATLCHFDCEPPYGFSRLLDAEAPARVAP